MFMVRSLLLFHSLSWQLPIDATETTKDATACTCTPSLICRDRNHGRISRPILLLLRLFPSPFLFSPSFISTHFSLRLAPACVLRFSSTVAAAASTGATNASARSTRRFAVCFSLLCTRHSSVQALRGWHIM